MTLRLDDELSERLRHAAYVTRRTKQSIVFEALREWLDTKSRDAGQQETKP